MPTINGCNGGFLAAACLIATALSCSGANPKPAHVPANHRPAVSLCPDERGPGMSLGSCGSTVAACTNDGVCTAGVNGRCLYFGGGACNQVCSYDECASDSDCPGNAPCACRRSPSDSRANACAPASKCRIDADCGAGGFCSPTTILPFCHCRSVCHDDAGGGDYLCGDNCGHGYFCHTPKDTCVDDTDCTDGELCNFDLPSQSWKCGQQMCPL
jgi:hypothetical protein